MSSFASDEEKQEVLRRMARRYAHLKNRPMPDHIADMRRQRPVGADEQKTPSASTKAQTPTHEKVVDAEGPRRRTR